jgi:hypothetical protein
MLANYKDLEKGIVPASKKPGLFPEVAAGMKKAKAAICSLRLSLRWSRVLTRTIPP